MGPRSDNRGYVCCFSLRSSTSFVLQWVRGLITAVMQSDVPRRSQCAATSMGPRSDNRGYDPESCDHLAHFLTSMGPRSDNRGYDALALGAGQHVRMTSMGPRSDNRGYGGIVNADTGEVIKLQWVRGLITAVMGEPTR